MGKRKKKHDAHHGGAWKVAYADFVTAMMALFMVLWISAQDEEIRLATSRYFQNPFQITDSANSVMQFEPSRPKEDAIENEFEPSRPQQPDIQFLHELASEFYRLLNIEESEESPIDIQITPEGLRITLYDRARQPLFKDGTDEFTEWGSFVMQNLAWIMDRHEMQVRIDAVTAKDTVEERPGYGPWELTADRANETRRQLEHYALSPDKVARVTGYGDRKTLEGIPPTDQQNQRVEISLEVTEAFPETP